MGGQPHEPDNAEPSGLDADGEALFQPVRVFERVAFAAKVTLTGQHGELTGVTQNLSLGGVFVTVDSMLAVGAVVRLHMALPDGESVTTEAVVRRCAVAGERFGAGIGLQFVDLSADNTKRVARFAAEQEPMFWEESPRRSGDPGDSPELPRAVAMTFLPTIRARAHRLAHRLPSHILVDDLVGAGFVGLVEAYRRHQAGRGDAFEVYANTRIQGAMLDELRSIDPLSRHVRAQARKIRAATRRLELRHRRDPDDSEVAAEIGWSVETLRNRKELVARGSETPLTYGPEEGAVETSDPDGFDAEGQVEQQQRGHALRSALEALPPRLKQILDLRYEKDLSLREIGSVLGVTESRVSQLHTEAIERMRAVTARN